MRRGAHARALLSTIVFGALLPLFIAATTAHVLRAQDSGAALTQGMLVVTDSGGKAVPFATVQLNGGTARITDLHGRVDLGNSQGHGARIGP